MSYVKRCKKLELAQMPEFVHSQIQYEVIMGSFAYGVSSDTSDIDVYGFCVPNKNIVFPHLSEKYIYGFDRVPNNFEQWQQHGIIDKSYKPPKEFDFTIYNIVKYFKLCAEGNPNMIDSLFVPQNCIVHSTQLGVMVRENRHLFLSKKCWHTFKGYAYSQMHKMQIKNPEGKRKEMVEKYGYDVKFAYHLVRLLNEVEQILLEGTVDLQRNREQLKMIRRGEWTQKQVEEYFETKERNLESLYLKSELPHKPRYNEIRKLLWDCLEMHFSDKIKPKAGDLFLNLFQDLDELVNKYRETTG